MRDLRSHRNDHAAVWEARKIRCAALDVGSIKQAQLHPGCAREGLDDSPLSGRAAGVESSEYAPRVICGATS